MSLATDLSRIHLNFLGTISEPLTGKLMDISLDLIENCANGRRSAYSIASSLVATHQVRSDMLCLGNLVNSGRRKSLFIHSFPYSNEGKGSGQPISCHGF